MIDFSGKDLQQIALKEITQNKVAEQIEMFEEGIPYVFLERPAVIGDGIVRIEEAEETTLVERFNTERDKLNLLKFVPASGAASRMFKSLFAFLDTYDPERDRLEDYLGEAGQEFMKTFWNKLSQFPFYEDLEGRLGSDWNSEGEKAVAFVSEMLHQDKLRFDFFPKGLLPFHKYGGFVATAFEEHLLEAARYASSAGKARAHFTISPQHETYFKEEYERALKRLARAAEVEYEFTYSFQKPSTDTIAVTETNEPFRDEEGNMVFRPGGHGALIENLNEQDADIIFIKNIDNVVVKRLADKVAHSKKILAAILMEVQEKLFSFGHMLDENDMSGEDLREIQEYLMARLNVRFAENYSSFNIAEQIEILKDKINRPIRVCGMVKNEGEPGGGPFWIRDTKDHVSLQIVESAQVDLSDTDQAALFSGSTHFNPVDLVCGVKNYKGEKYNLLNFVDTKQGFISSKTKDGRALKALELPGLWNGGMAFWNTIFVEVPLITFNPVKTINDLLKPAHQA